ncbi:MAG TPA: ATP-binding protein [bacterium]|nr:ATP-binding protein [bacterium]
MLEELAQDILDIGLNAASAEAGRIAIRVTEDMSADRLSILLADNGKGMSEDLRERVLNGFATTKTGHSKPVGLGIALLRQAADLCEGRFRLCSREGQGTLVAVSMVHSHIDRPPMGDLAASIMALCSTEHGMEVRFEHRCDDRSFVFDSAEILERKNGIVSAFKLMEIDDILREKERNLLEETPKLRS